ncbi:DNA cytosine methyltransferase [Streptomyces chilikensis]|uniref:DNA (cytosine-5-)-methyltransferase n=1 Tax=Streptomyces chilikensis TaxID=1194079 RepID=A0ABV3ETZ7_9ACTN
MTSPAPRETAPTSNNEDEYHILDLFAGPGGLDVAAHFLGKKAIGIEWDANACETRYKAGLATLHADVFEVRKNETLCKELVTKATVLTAGPPCQTFSVAGSGAGRRALAEVTELLEVLAEKGSEEVDRKLKHLHDPEELAAATKETDASAVNDPRTALVLEPLHWILAAMEHGVPFETVVLEQVPTVLPVWGVYERLLRGGLNGRHYRAYSDVLCTEEYGVPQTRKRAVLIARLLPEGETPDPSREADRCLLPEATHQRFVRSFKETKTAENAQGDGSLFPKPPKKPKRPLWRSMAQALEDAKSFLPDGIDRSKTFEVVSNYGSGGVSANRGRRTSDLPAFTVTGKVSRNVVQDLKGRKLDRFSVHEAGVLQSFPANYPWDGKDQPQQVGNAVPPRFAAHLLSSAMGLDAQSLTNALEAMGRWPDVPEEETERLRKLGCGDFSSCPTPPRHP